MKVSRKTIWQMTPDGYELISADIVDYDGPVALAKGGKAAVPDPTQQIAAEQNANQYNVVSPTGSINYSKDPSGRTTQTTTLSPSEQKQLDTSNQIAETMLTGAQKKIPGLSDTSFDYNDQGSTAAKAAYQRQVDLLNPEFAKQDTAWEDRLANQGIPLGSEAYNDSLRQHENDKNFALTQAAQQSETEGTQLALSQRQQQYNELAAALGGQQLNPVGAFSQAAAPVDVAGAYAQKNQASIAQQMANQQSQNALLGAGAQLGGAYLSSRRPSGAGGQAATSGATQSYTAPSNFESYSSSAPNVTDTAGGTSTYYGEPSDGLDYVTPSVSKIGTPTSTPSGGWLSSVGKGLNAGVDAYGVYSGVKQGGVKGYGGALAGASDLAGLAGYGGTTATSLGAIGNAASGNYVGAAKDIYGLIAKQGATTGASGASAGASAAGGASSLLGTIGTGAGYAGLAIAAGEAIHSAVNAHGDELRNIDASLKAGLAKPVSFNAGKVNTGYYQLSDGRLLTKPDYEKLAGAWYGATIAPDGNRDEWQQKYNDLLGSLKGHSLPSGFVLKDGKVVRA